MSDNTISTTAELHGGPLDGQTTNDGCTFPGGSSIYAPDTHGRWVWQDDQPSDIP